MGYPLNKCTGFGDCKKSRSFNHRIEVKDQMFLRESERENQQKKAE